MLDDSLIDQNQKVRDALESVFERYGVRYMRFTTTRLDPPQRFQKVQQVLVLVTSRMNKEHINYDTTRSQNPHIPPGLRKIVPEVLKEFNLDEILNAIERLGANARFSTNRFTINNSVHVELWMGSGSNCVTPAELGEIRATVAKQ